MGGRKDLNMDYEKLTENVLDIISSISTLKGKSLPEELCRDATGEIIAEIIKAGAGSGRLDTPVSAAGRDGEYRALTIQLLQLRNEIFAGDPMDKDTFTDTYLNGLGKYELKIAKEQDIWVG